jgi:hypothetical protein
MYQATVVLPGKKAVGDFSFPAPGAVPGIPILM